MAAGAGYVKAQEHASCCMVLELVRNMARDGKTEQIVSYIDEQLADFQQKCSDSWTVDDVNGALGARVGRRLDRGSE